MNVDIRELAYIGIGTSKLSEWRAFAEEVLGVPVVATGVDGALYLRVDRTHHRIGVHPDDHEGLRYVGFSVANEASLEDARRALRTAEIKVSEGTPEECEDRRVQELIHFHDPAGHRVEICHGQLWKVEEPVVRPTRPISGLRALGHVVLGVEDAIGLRDFYLETLGFRLTDYRSGAIYFMRCNPRHHSLAIAQSSTPGLHHFFLEVESLDDVGLTDDAARTRGLQVGSIGRHGNDRAVTCYLRSPSGFQVEYGCHGLLIDEATWVAHEYTVGDLWGHHRTEEDSIVLARTGE